MENLLIIGDVAGQYDALLHLLNKIPANEKKRIIFVGDLIDRGPKSLEVVNFVKMNGFECLLGNHEDMMIDHYRKTGRYSSDNWIANNGGSKTAGQYKKFPYKNDGRNILPEHLFWMEKLPQYIETKEYFISHGIWAEGVDLKDAQRLYAGEDGWGSENMLTWNRYDITKRDKFQIHGHNGKIQMHLDKDGTPFGLCIDGQHEGVIGAFSTKSKTIYREPFSE